jgi:hypothetical protein
MVPGQVGYGITAFWSKRLSNNFWMWPRALVSFAAQILLTCGLYNILDYGVSLPSDKVMDVFVLGFGLLGSSVINAVYAWREASEQERYSKLNMSIEHVSEARGLTASERKDGPIVSALHEAELNSAIALNLRLEKNNFGSVGAEQGQREGTPNAARSTKTFQDMSNFAVASASYFFQVATWLGCDRILARQMNEIEDDWAKAGDLFLWIFAGLSLMTVTDSLLYWSCVLSREEAGNLAFFAVPEPPLRKNMLLLVFLRNLISVYGYYLHLTAFWFLIDELVWPSGTERNTCYTLFGFALLAACGTFLREAG